MIPGLGGIDPRKMQQIMRQMGIKQESLEVSRVIIEKSDGGKIIIDPANVEKISMNGQDSWQVSGKSQEEAGGISEEDILLVMEKSGASKEEVSQALEQSNGDIAEAISLLIK